MNKYRKIIFLIISLIVFNIIIVLVNSYISHKIVKFNDYGKLLAEQQVYLDKISKDIIDINNISDRLLKENPSEKEISHFLEETYSQVQDTTEFYDYLVSSISAFSYGGTLEIKNNSYQIPQLTGKDALLVKRIDEIWLPLSALINKMTSEIARGKLDELKSNVRFSADYIRKYSEILSGYFQKYKDLYQNQANYYANWLQILQISAIAFTVIIFGFLTYFGLRSLIHTDVELEKSRKETADIMKTVKEGLFLVDEDLNISSQYSQHLEEILNQREISGHKLDELLSQFISKKDFETTKDFIEQLFNEEVIEELIEELNPLDKVQVFIHKNQSDSEKKYLSFKFSRVYTGESITNVLISVADITRQIILEERLEKERLQHDEQIEMLSSILSIPAINLQSFIRHISSACNTINNILRSSTNLNKSQLIKKSEQIFREVHAIKGESSALNLRSFVSLTEEMETKIAQLKIKSDISGRDFLPLTIDLDKLLELNKKIIALQKRVVGEEIEPIESIRLMPDKTEAEVMQLQNLVTDVAKRNQKEVALLVRGWQSVQQLQEWQQDKLREVIIQLLRNAVVHGIEEPIKRQENQKNKTGKILCDVVDHHNGFLNIQVIDDGNGIDFQTLYQKALADGTVNKNETIEQAKPKLLRYLFSSGISTAKHQNEDAGRGVGMDIVKERLKELSAKIMLSSEEGKMTRIKMQVPILKN